MITTRGKTFIKNYLANQASQVVGAASFGIGATTANVSDERLQFEFARIPLKVVAYDAVNNRLVFKGTLPQEVQGKIYEVGLWTSDVAGTNPSDDRIVTTFDSETELWTPTATYDTTTTRIGKDALRQTPAVSTTVTNTLDGLSLDFIENSSQDTFVLAYNNTNANVANIKVRFMTDASNYYEMTITSPTAGYKFSSQTKGGMGVVGTPDWAEIVSIQIATTANATAAADVQIDGLRIEDNDIFTLDYGMIARLVPATPVDKPVGRVLDFEYTLAVSV